MLGKYLYGPWTGTVGIISEVLQSMMYVYALNFLVLFMFLLWMKMQILGNFSFVKRCKQVVSLVTCEGSVYYFLWHLFKCLCRLWWAVLAKCSTLLIPSVYRWNFGNENMNYEAIARRTQCVICQSFVAFYCLMIL